MDRTRHGRERIRGCAIAAVVGFAVLAGLGCHRTGIVEVWIFNQTPSAFEVAGQTVVYWSSTWLDIAPGDTARLPITRDSLPLATLVMNSVVPKDDPSRYGAVVNVREDSLSRLMIVEFSPWIDAHLENP